MILMAKVRIPDDHPIALLLNRMDLRPPFRTAGEERVIMNFLGRNVFSLLANEDFGATGSADVLSIMKQMGDGEERQK